MSGRKPGIKEDFICSYCNHYICSKSEYMEADANQRKKWSVYWNIHNKTKSHELKMLRAQTAEKLSPIMTRTHSTINSPSNSDDDEPFEDLSSYNYCYMFDTVEERVVSVDLNNMNIENSQRFKELSFRQFTDRDNMFDRFIMVFKETGTPVEEPERKKMRLGRLIPKWLSTYCRYINSWVNTNDEFKKLIQKDMSDTKNIWSKIEMDYRITDDPELVIEMLKNMKLPMTLEEYRFKVFN